MSKIRALAPKVCPQCSSENTFVVTRQKIECSHCGYLLRGSDGKPTPPPEFKPAATKPAHDLSRYRASYRIIHDDGVEPYVEAAFTTAMDYVHRQQWDEAIRNLWRCIEYRSDFTDAHLWLGRLLPDEEERRKHLKLALAQQPTLGDALQELMILDGELSGTVDEYMTPEKLAVGAAVLATAKNVRCPRCASPQLVREDENTVYCKFCGYRGSPNAKKSEVRGQLFAKANLKRRAQKIVWVTGDRVLKCGSCGAQRTIAAHTLKHECPFCGSTNILESDALDTFEQPDGIVPFRISEEQARARLDARLNSRIEKLKGWFVENRAERVEFNGVYLPFWAFDVIIEVSRTVTVIKPPDKNNFYQPSIEQMYRNEKMRDFLTDVLVPAVESPPRQLVQRLNKFDVDAAKPYAPELIAQYSAELYTLDFDRAGLDAQSIAATVMKERHALPENEYEQVTVYPMVQQMSYRLLLLPIWSVTIHEADQQVRPGLIHGQTGQVVLGKAHPVGDFQRKSRPRRPK